MGSRCYVARALLLLTPIVAAMGCTNGECDIFAQDSLNPFPSAEPANESCYILFTRPGAPTVTFPAFPDDGQQAPGLQDQMCNYINTCRNGSGCVLPDDPEDFQNLVCAQFCDASNSGGPTCDDTAAGGPGPAYSCYRVNLIYSDVPDVPDYVGMCARTELWGTPPQKQRTPMRPRLPPPTEPPVRARENRESKRPARE